MFVQCNALTGRGTKSRMFAEHMQNTRTHNCERLTFTQLRHFFVNKYRFGRVFELRPMKFHI